jgi:ATP-dependent RNA helicase RhlE
MELLLHMLANQQMYSVLVFSRTKHGADKISRKLKAAGIEATAIHSDRTQSQRLHALDGFRRGKYQVMVATDIAARGLDISGISHVINYDVPTHEEDYIHRIGRTGRAEATGDAITFVSRDENKFLLNIEKFIGREFHMEKFRDFAYKTPIETQSPAAKQSAKSGLNKGKFPTFGRRPGASQRSRRRRPRR